jgi:hypothetical protein
MAKVIFELLFQRQGYIIITAKVAGQSLLVDLGNVDR